jgi:hypothetical protein
MGRGCSFIDPTHNWRCVSATPVAVDGSHFTTLDLDNESGYVEPPDQTFKPNTCKLYVTAWRLLFTCADGVQHIVRFSGDPTPAPTPGFTPPT